MLTELNLIRTVGRVSLRNAFFKTKFTISLSSREDERTRKVQLSSKIWYRDGSVKNELTKTGV